MKILVWCPFVNLGGGVRLLMQLVPAMSRHQEVASVRLVVPKHAIEAHDLRSYQTHKLEIVSLARSELQNRLLTQKPGGFNQRVMNALLRRLLPPYIARIEAAEMWQHSGDCDVVYAFWPHGRPFQVAQTPVVCTYQDTTFLDFPEILGGSASQHEHDYAESWLNGAAQVVVSSEAVQQRLAFHFGERFADVRVIHHNILPEQSRNFTPEKPRHIPERYLLYPANINPHKNHDMLLIAWARFSRRSEIPLVLVGEGTQVLSAAWDRRNTTYWQQERLIGLAQRLDLKPGRDFFALGYVSDDEMTTLMQHATALIMPTLSEGGGSYPVEEAMTYGIPVICSNIPVLREHLAMHSAPAAWFDPLSADSISAAINDMLDRYAVYKEAAVRDVRDPRPTWNDIAGAYVDVFSQVTAGRDRR